ncbi:hypothetical protein KQH65_12385 [archaeon]|nr:hypothetical protein [archaeon]
MDEGPPNQEDSDGSRADMGAYGGQGLTINSEPGNLQPNTPANTSPLADETEVSPATVFEATDFDDPDPGDSQAASLWQIRAAAGSYAEPVYDSGDDFRHLSSLALPWGILAGDESYCWRVRYKDDRGGWSAFSPETCFTTLADNEPPETIIRSGPTEGGATGSPFVLAWTGEDNIPLGLTFSYQLDNGPWSTYTPLTWALFDLADGPHSLGVTSRDQQGNIDPSPALRSFTVDTLAPEISTVTVNEISSFSAEICWQTNEPADSLVEYGTEEYYGQFSSLDPELVTDHCLPLYELAADSTYHFRVGSSDSTGNAAWSDDFLFTTLAMNGDDLEGPEIVTVESDGLPLADASLFSSAPVIGVNAVDPSGVERIEFVLDGSLIHTEYQGSPFFLWSFNISSINDGDHVLAINAFDRLGNSSSKLYDIHIQLAPPAAPVISAPVNGQSFKLADINVSGSGEPFSEVFILVNAIPAAGPLSLDSSGMFTTSITLSEGVNILEATTQNRAGSSPKSSPVQVDYDTGPPASPAFFTLRAKAGGLISLSWQEPAGEIPARYKVYRSETSFTDPTQASCLTPFGLDRLYLDDIPASDGLYYYGVTSLDLAGNESDLSVVRDAASDRQGPTLLTIDYSPEGPSEGSRFAPGQVGVILTFSEQLAAAPILKLVLANGSLLPVSLAPAGNNAFSGSFDISPGTLSGSANWHYYGTDLLGNSSTLISAPAALTIDTDGPSVSSLEFIPQAPFHNDPASPLLVSVNMNLDQEVEEGSVPELNYKFADNSGPYPVNLTPDTENPFLWLGNFSLPATAGETSGDYVDFTFQATDDLGNSGSDFLCARRYEVYQGDLPPLAIPDGLNAQALAGGKVRLSWNEVADAAGYQLYRQAPGEGDLSPLGGIVSETLYEEIPGPDGLYSYSVASVRQINDETAVSAQCPQVSVTADSIPPNPPTNLQVELTGSGISASWQMAQGEVPTAYRLYRDDSPIGKVTGLAPIIDNIATLSALDREPGLSDHYYAVTAIDSAGNESAPSINAFFEADLMPVTSLVVRLEENGLPQLSWSHPGGDVIGFRVYEINGQDGELLHEELLTEPSFTHTGYNNVRTVFEVVAVDSDDMESLPCRVVLPALEAALSAESVLYRGLINRITLEVTNLDPTEPVDIDQLTLRVAGQERQSPGATIEPGSETAFDLLLAGQADWQQEESYTLTLLTGGESGGTAEIVLSGTIPVEDRGLSVEILNEELIRGGTGGFSFALHNTGEEAIELVTAMGQGTLPTPDIRFHLLDSEENILASADFLQVLGSVITRADGVTVVRLLPDASFLSDPVSMLIPLSAPDEVKIRLQIDQVTHYDSLPESADIRSLSDTDVPLSGPGAEVVESRSLKDTSYAPVVTEVTPSSLINNGENTITIKGQALNSESGEPLVLVPVRLAVGTSSSLRTLTVYTDDDGLFSSSYLPLANEKGSASVCATHPSVSDRCRQGSFYLTNLELSPYQAQVDAIRNLSRQISLDFSYAGQETLHDLTLIYDPTLQPDGILTEGISIGNITSLGDVAPGEKGKLSFTFSGSDTAPDSGRIILAAVSDETPASHLKLFTLSYGLTTGQAVLTPDQPEIFTGVHPGETMSERLLLENRGGEGAENVLVELLPPDGSPVLDWIQLISPAALGTLDSGQARDITISVQPDSTVAHALYEYRVRISSSSQAALEIPLYVTVSSSETGSARIYAYDPYVLKDDGQGGVIQGLDGARVVLQHATAYTLTYEGLTDSMGNCDFSQLPIGRYNYTVSASEHHSSSGTLLVKPGITVRREIYLEVAAVHIEWSVVPTTIEDRYEIKLETTYQTDVPEPVMIITPASLTIPDMVAGERFFGEYEITNHGLVTAKKCDFYANTDDADFLIELLGEMPEEMGAGETVVIPFRISRLSESTATQVSLSLDSQAADTTSSNGRACVPYCYNPCPWDERFERCSSRCSNISGFVGKGSMGDPSNPSSGVPPDIDHTVAGGGTISGLPTRIGGFECLESLFCPPDPACGSSDPSASEVDLVNREYTTEETDLELMVSGLPIKVSRRYANNQWTFNFFRERLNLTMDNAVTSGGISSVSIDNLPFNRVAVMTADEYFNESTQSDEGEEPTVYGENYAFAARDFAIRTVGGYWDATDPTDKEYFWEGFHLDSRKGYEKDFDKYGRITSYGDLNGNQVTLAWEEAQGGNLLGIFDPTGRQVLWYEYDNDGYITAIQDLSGRRVEYAYTDGKLIAMTDVRGGIWTYNYNGEGKLISKTDPENRTYTIEYNSGGDLQSVKDEEGQGREYSYSLDESSLERVATVVNPSGLMREVAFDNKGRVIRKSFNQKNATDFIQSDQSLTVAPEDEIEEKKMEFDEWGNLTRLIHPDGTMIRAEYHQRTGALKRLINERGVETLSEFDERGNKTATIEAKGTGVERRTEYTYDERGNLLTITKPVGAVVSFIYDEFGNVIRRTDAMGGVEEFSYDALNRMTVFKDARGHEFEYGYDAAGNVISITNPLGYTVQREFDGVGNLTAVVNENNKRTEFSYDQHNRITLITDALGKTISFVYDAEGNLVQRVDQNSNVQEMSYDIEGNLTSVTDPENNTTTFVYTFSEATDCSSCENDENRKFPISIHYPTYSEKYEYNHRGQITRKTQVVDEITSYVWVYTYDGAGNLTQEIDPEHHYTSYVYDALNRLVQITDPLGQVTRYDYDARDNLTSEIDPAGLITTYGYDLNNRLISETRPGINPVSYEYDPAGNMTKQIATNGQETTYQHDALNRLILSTDPLGNQISYEYDPVGHLLKESYPDGSVSQHVYDDLGRETRTIDASGASVVKVYDNAGNVISMTDKAGNTWLYAYDGLNRLTVTTSPYPATDTQIYEGPWLRKSIDFNGKIVLFERDGLGRVTKEVHKMNDSADTADDDDLIVVYHHNFRGQWTEKTDPLSRTTTRIFDPLGRETCTVYPDGRNFTKSYTASGQLQTTLDENGKPTIYAYNEFDQLIEINDPISLLEKFTYDNAGFKISREDSLGRKWEYSYDEMGRLKDEKDPSAAVSTTTYNSFGNVVSYGDRKGNTTILDYDALGRLASVQDGTGLIKSYTYDGAGRLSTLTDGNGNTTSYDYDALGNNSRITYADTTTEEFVHDAMGSVVKKKLRDGSWIDYGYDDIYRHTLIDYPGTDEDASFSYDKGSRLVSAANASSDIIFTYDIMNRLASVNQDGRTLTYEHDDSLRTTTVTYPSGHSIVQSRDLRGRIVRIDKDGTEVLNQSFDGADSLVNRTLLTEVDVSLTYDNLGRVRAMTYSRNGTLLAGLSYHYDAEGNLVSSKRLHDLQHSQTFTYDAGNRLEGWLEGELDEFDSIPLPQKTVIYQLDQSGNRLSLTENGSTENRLVNELNQYVEIDGQAILYDVNGNLIDDGINTYEYTVAGQLKRIVRKSDQQILAEYAYNPFFRRVSATIDTNNREYVYEGDHIVEEYHDFTLASSYFYGGSLDDLLLMSQGAQDYLYLTDRLGSIQAVTDASGTIIEQYRYSPLGEPEILDAALQPMASSAIGNLYMFATKRWDEESQSYDSRRRQYHPGLGRFLQPDSLGYVDSMNLYQYAQHNPLKWIDPLGENSILAQGIEGYIYQDEPQRNATLQALDALHRQGTLSDMQHQALTMMVNCQHDFQTGIRVGGIEWTADTLQALGQLNWQNVPGMLSQLAKLETWGGMLHDLLRTPCKAIQCVEELNRKIGDGDCYGSGRLGSRMAIETAVFVDSMVPLGRAGKTGMTAAKKAFAKAKRPKVDAATIVTKYRMNPKYFQAIDDVVTEYAAEGRKLEISVYQGRPSDPFNQMRAESKGIKPKPKGVTNKSGPDGIARDNIGNEYVTDVDPHLMLIDGKPPTLREFHEIRTRLKAKGLDLQHADHANIQKGTNIVEQYEIGLPDKKATYFGPDGIGIKSKAEVKRDIQKWSPDYYDIQTNPQRRQMVKETAMSFP